MVMKEKRSKLHSTTDIDKLFSMKNCKSNYSFIIFAKPREVHAGIDVCSYSSICLIPRGFFMPSLFK
jgi:hypothetical protein